MISETSTPVEQALPADELTEGVGERAPRILEPARRVARRRRGWLVGGRLLAADRGGSRLRRLSCRALIFGGAVRNVDRSRVREGVRRPHRMHCRPGSWSRSCTAFTTGTKSGPTTRRSPTFQPCSSSHWSAGCCSGLCRLMPVAHPTLRKLFIFWASAIVLVPLARACARAAPGSSGYLQNTVIVGAGDVGQLIARKLLHHPEYGINVVGLVDAEPKERGPGLADLTLLGGTQELPAIIRRFDLSRVIVAFSRESARGHPRPHQRVEGLRCAGGCRASALRADPARPQSASGRGRAAAQPSAVPSRSLVAADQAQLRPSDGGARAHRLDAGLRGARRADQARLPRPRLLPPTQDGRRRRNLPDLQVPLHACGRGGAQAEVRTPEQIPRGWRILGCSKSTAIRESRGPAAGFAAIPSTSSLS